MSILRAMLIGVLAQNYVILTASAHCLNALQHFAINRNCSRSNYHLISEQPMTVYGEKDIDMRYVLEIFEYHLQVFFDSDLRYFLHSLRMSSWNSM